MAQMKVEDIRAMSDDQMEDAVLNLKKERFNLRFQRATGQLENTSRLREARRDIARIKTIAAQNAREEEVRGRIMPKRILQGVVVSDKQAKTVVVRVDRRFTHPIYKKTIRRSKNYHAHDENNQFKPGDMVWIEESEADLEVEALDRGPGRAEENRLRPSGMAGRESGKF